MQSINFCLIAPSGSGGGIVSELLDYEYGNHHRENPWNKTNVYNPKTNEYAGSINSWIYFDYHFHKKHNDFPEWNEKTVLLGKNSSPIEFFRNEITCPKTYWIDVEEHDDYTQDLKFVKKYVGCGGQMHSMYHFFFLWQKADEKHREGLIKRGDEYQLNIMVWDRFTKMVNSVSDIIDPMSHLAAQYFVQCGDALEFDADHFREFLRNQYLDGGWANEHMYEPEKELSDFTEVIRISYNDILEGNNTNTNLDLYKKELSYYNLKNEELLDNFFRDIGL